MITWGETIDIITKAFRINQKDLAKCLNISESVVSRAKTPGGKLTFEPEEIFNAVFDPNVQNSLAHELEATERNLLDILKEIIKSQSENVQKTLADYNYWEITDYKPFVLGWLKLTGRVLTAEDYSNMEGFKPSVETPDEQMVRIFEQSVSEYHIATYICNLPNYLTDGFSSFTKYSDIENFIKAIQDNILGKFIAQQNEDVFIKIRDFNRTLESYNGLFVFPVQVNVWNHPDIIIRMPGMIITDNDIIAVIDSERAEIENNLNPNVPEEKEEMKQKLLLLDVAHEIVKLRKRLCELFEQICPGKHLLIF